MREKKEKKNLDICYGLFPVCSCRCALPWFDIGDVEDEVIHVLVF